ncbi:MAG: ATP-binding protein [Candidatus Hodarchaeales archaeon]
MTVIELTQTLLKAHEYYLLGQISKLQKKYSEARHYLEQAQILLDKELQLGTEFATKAVWQVELELIVQELNLLIDRSNQRNISGNKSNLGAENVEEDIDSIIDTMRIVETKQDGWGDIKGLELVKKTLEKLVIIPKKYPEMWDFNDQPARSVLMFGPPGCGKTMIVRNLVKMTGLPAYIIVSGRVLSKWFGESEKIITRLFYKAQQEPEGCILFFDEFDAFFGSNRYESDTSQRIRSTILTSLDGYHKTTPNKVIVIATSNYPDRFGGAVMRRFDRKIYVPPPDYQTIKKICNAILEKVGIQSEQSNEKWGTIFNSLLGYTSKEISDIVSTAIWNSYEKILEKGKDLEKSIQTQIKKMTAGMTPFFCTFEALEPQTYIFLDQEYGFPKTGHTRYEWEKAMLRRKNQLINYHPKPRIIYRRNATRNL